MTLYDIDAQMYKAFDAAIDAETGEIIDEKALYLFESLQLDRNKKIENTACLIKNIKADAEALKTEAAKLTARQRAAENRAKWLQSYLEQIMNGEKFKSSKAVITYMTYKSVQVDDLDSIPDEFKRVKIEPNKVDIKEAIKDGKDVPGASLVSKTSMVVK